MSFLNTIKNLFSGNQTSENTQEMPRQSEIQPVDEPFNIQVSYMDGDDNHFWPHYSAHSGETKVTGMRSEEVAESVIGYMNKAGAALALKQAGELDDQSFKELVTQAEEFRYTYALHTEDKRAWITQPALFNPAALTHWTGNTQLRYRAGDRDEEYGLLLDESAVQPENIQTAFPMDNDGLKKTYQEHQEHTEQFGYHSEWHPTASVVLLEQQDGSWEPFSAHSYENAYQAAQMLEGVARVAKTHEVEHTLDEARNIVAEEQMIQQEGDQQRLSPEEEQAELEVLEEEQGLEEHADLEAEAEAFLEDQLSDNPVIDLKALQASTQNTPEEPPPQKSKGMER